MLDVIGLLNEIEIMGGEIDGETQVDMILETLPESFDSFKLNYSMNKLSYSLTELMKELQAAEALFNKGKNKVGEANLSVKKGSGSKFKKSNKASTSKSASKPLVAPKVDDAVKDQSEDRCHHCNRTGHWKRNCPKYLNEVNKKKRKGCALVTQACLVADSYNSWIVDSGATNHICCTLQGYKERRRLEPGEFSFSWGNGALVSATSVGSVKLYFSSNRFMVCKDIYYVPDFGRNVLSFGQLIKQGFVLNVNDGFDIYFNGKLITTACLVNDLFLS